MQLNVMWKWENLFPRLDLSKMMVGILTDEHPNALGRSIILDAQGEYVSPDKIHNEVNVYLDEPLNEQIRSVILEGIKSGYRLVARDNRQWPAPRICVHLRVFQE